MQRHCNKNSTTKVVLITGGARRIGAKISQLFHQEGYTVLIHCHQSQRQAEQLCGVFNQKRSNSAYSIAFDLCALTEKIPKQLAELLSECGGLDVLVHNAAVFYQTSIGAITPKEWQHMLDINVRASVLLSQMLVPWLKARHGSIVQITDIHASRPMKAYSVYCISKAAALMAMQALAKELAPCIRVNAVAPGAVMLPEGENALSESQQQQLLTRIPLRKWGQASDVANAVYFLAQQTYITGQVLAIDGGRMLTI